MFHEKVPVTTRLTSQTHEGLYRRPTAFHSYFIVTYHFDHHNYSIAMPSHHPSGSTDNASAPCLTCTVCWKTYFSTGRTHLGLELLPWQHFTRTHTMLHWFDLNLKNKETLAFSGQGPSTAIQGQSRGSVSSLKYISLEHCMGNKLVIPARGPQQVISGEWGVQDALRA